MRWLIVAVVAGCGRIDFDPGRDGGSVASPDAGPPVAGPEAWYRLEAAPDQGVADSSGNGHTGSCIPGTCPTVTEGRIGNGYDFTAGAYVAVPDDGAFSDDVAVTVSGWAWFRPAAGYAVISKPHVMGDGNSWQYEILPPDLGCVTGTLTMDCTPGIVAFETWQHFAFVYDGTMKRLYLDGIQRAQWPGTLAFDAHDVVIGADYRLDAAGNFMRVVIPMEGVLDEILIYGRALTDAELAVLAAPQ